jgi:hypothetical protein
MFLQNIGVLLLDHVALHLRWHYVPEDSTFRKKGHMYCKLERMVRKQ